MAQCCRQTLSPRGEWHGFEATGDGDTIMIWTYGGAASLEAAGYVRQDAD